MPTDRRYMEFDFRCKCGGRLNGGGIMTDATFSEIEETFWEGHEEKGCGEVKWLEVPE
jgi:hypothetical protein